MKKLNSYQKLKNNYNNLWKLYYTARKKLHNLGQGINGNDILLDFDNKIEKVR